MLMYTADPSLSFLLCFCKKKKKRKERTKNSTVGKGKPLGSNTHISTLLLNTSIVMQLD